MSAKANGAPTISPQRSPPATAPPAAKSPRRMGFIWCGWSIEACVSLSPLAGRGWGEGVYLLGAESTRSESRRGPLTLVRFAHSTSPRAAGRGKDDSPKLLLDDPPVHRRQRDQIGERRAFVDAVHGLPDQAEFQHRAIILDEARIRGTTGGREFRLTAGHFGDRGCGEIGEWARLCDEDVGVRRQPVEGIKHAAGRGVAGALFEQCLERSLAVAVVVADVEAGARFAGNEIDGLIPDVDRGELEVRRRELRAAVVERRLQRGDERNKAADRIVGAVR